MILLLASSFRWKLEHGPARRRSEGYAQVLCDRRMRRVLLPGLALSLLVAIAQAKGIV